MMDEAHPAWADEVIYWNVPDLSHWSPDAALPEIECQVLLLLNVLVGRELTMPVSVSPCAREDDCHHRLARTD
jgi:hypothetical protein